MHWTHKNVECKKTSKNVLKSEQGTAEAAKANHRLNQIKKAKG
jgi:hypothetical protein